MAPRRKKEKHPRSKPKCVVTLNSPEGEIEDVISKAFQAVFCKSDHFEDGMLDFLAAAVSEEIKVLVRQETVEASSSESEGLPLLDAPSWFDIVERVTQEVDEHLYTVLDQEEDVNGVTPLLKVVDVLEGLGAVRAEPEEAADDIIERDCFQAGDRVMAVLDESGEWHEAVIKEVDVKSPSSVKEGLKYHSVVFTEWQKPQLVSEEDCVHEYDVVHENAQSTCMNDKEGECPICHRTGQLTYHHLIPRTTHAMYLKKGLTSQMEELRRLMAKKRGCSMDELSLRVFLGQHGVDLCRKCHSHVHKIESEKSLAKDWNSLDLLLEHPAMQKWSKYAAKQKNRF